jgi:glycopeptide antibiotics resistance protein
LRLDYGYSGSGVCDLSRLGPPRIDEWLLLGDPALNVLLFVPLGVAIAFLPRTRRTAGVVVVAAASPFVIELVQLAVKPLGRGCQSGDVVDNLMGLVLGILGGTAVIAASRRRPGA